MIIRKCQSGGAYIVRQENPQTINLEEVSKQFTTIAKTPVLIIIKDKFKVTVYKNGKLMVECNSEQDAKDQAEKIISQRQ